MLTSYMVLSCRAGIIPLVLNRDIGGPMGRTVTDVARLFTALTDFTMFPEGYDPRDPVTAFRLNYTHPSNYTQFLDPNGLQVWMPRLHRPSMQHFFLSRSADN